MTCSVCGYPDRRIWPPSNDASKFNDIASENWMFLSSCTSCEALWCGVPYEPYASFTYYVLWERTKEEWFDEINSNDGVKLHDWHLNELNQHRHSLIIVSEVLVETLLASYNYLSN